VVPAQPTLGQTIKEGFGYGVGSAVAHRVVGAFLGPQTVAVKPVVPAQAQTEDLWVRCLEQTNYDTEKCSQFKPKE
jgi:hypothetical protein